MDIAVGTPFDPNDGNTSHTVTWAGGEGVNLVVINESFQNCNLKFAGGQTAYCPANDRRQFTLSGEMAQAQNQAVFTIQSQINDKNTVNQIVVEVYAPGEEVPETYPSPLIRQANVAGTIIAQLVELFTPNNTAVLIAGQSTAADPQVAIDSGGFIEVGGAGNGDASGKIQIDQTSPLVVNAQGAGSSGTATIYEPFGVVGNSINLSNTFKFTVIKFTNWLNKTAFTAFVDDYITGCVFICIGNAPFTFKLNDGADLNTHVVTALASAGGSLAATTTINSTEIGTMEHEFNQINFAVSAGVNSGWIILIGL